jgi:short-subunit dehydrogenase
LVNVIKYKEIKIFAIYFEYRNIGLSKLLVPLMTTQLTKKKFGPWALITGASSGIGKEFAAQLAAQGFNLVLVARREYLLQAIAAELVMKYSIETRVIAVDLAEENFLNRLTPVTDAVDLGLVVSNAGLAHPGEFIRMKPDQLQLGVRINVLAHLIIARHYGERLAAKKRGGLILVSAMGALDGVPFMANSAATKAYVYSLGQGLHIELKRSGVSVLVVSPGATETSAMDDLGFRADELPMKPMSAAQCVEEALKALEADKANIIPGRTNRVMKALVPSSFSRNMMGKMLAKANGIQL